MNDNAIHRAVTLLDTELPGEFLASLRAEVLADLTAPAGEVELRATPARPWQSQPYLPLWPTQAGRRRGPMGRIVLAVALLGVVLATAAVITNRRIDPAEVAVDLNDVDAEQSLPLATRAVIAHQSLGSSWQEGEEPKAWLDAGVVAATNAAIPECAQLTEFGIWSPTTKSVTAHQFFYSFGDYMIHDTMVFASAADASRAMDVIDGQVFPRCLFDRYDRVTRQGNVQATSVSTPWTAPAIARHGDRQVIIGQYVEFTNSIGIDKVYLVNAYIQVGRAITWVDPRSRPDTLNPTFGVDRALDAATAALENVFGS